MSYWELAAAFVEEQGSECNYAEGYFVCPHCNEPVFEGDWTDDQMFKDNSVICPTCNELLGDSYMIEEVSEVW